MLAFPFVLLPVKLSLGAFCLLYARAPLGRSPAAAHVDAAAAPRRHRGSDLVFSADRRLSAASLLTGRR